MLTSKYLKPAILYKTQIEDKFKEQLYTDSYYYYQGWPSNGVPTICRNSEESGDWEFAIVDNDELIGYVGFWIDLTCRSANRFGLMSFKENSNLKIGFALRDIMKFLIEDLKLHRIEFRMVSGNSVESGYDYFLKLYNGNKITLHDATIDIYGKYHDVHIYEFIFKENMINEIN